MVINIAIANKRPTVDGTPVIVCGNSGYSIKFTFDAEWSAYNNKTARFVYFQNSSRKYKEVPFTGNTVEVPKLSNITEVQIGVYAGDLRTTTPATVQCTRSILCGGAVEQITPEEKAGLQGQIGDLSGLNTKDKSSLVAAINEAAKTGGSGGSGGAGEDGGYYTPEVSQVDENTMKVSFRASKEGMAAVADQNITLPAGETGAAGAQGPQGEKGEIGPQGEKGEKGDTGAQGIQGEKGEKGDKGDKGDPGEKGATGPTGPQGETGPAGADGKDGAKGDTGATGPQGPQGEKGDTGVQGPQGEKGDTGPQGEQGIQGEKGEKGDKGDKGDTGAAGKDGSDYVLTDSDRYDIATQAAALVDVSGKVDKNQGSANVGKILMVGTDGNLVLTDLPEAAAGDVVGVLDESNNILLTGAGLAEGTYSLKFENHNGQITQVGDLVVTTIVAPTYTNLAEPNETNTTDWSIWCNSARIGSDGTYRADDYSVTNYIPVAIGDVVRWEGLSLELAANMAFYKSDKASLCNIGASTPNVLKDSVITDLTTTATGGQFTIGTHANLSGLAYLRFTCTPVGNVKDVVITVNEPIE